MYTQVDPLRSYGGRTDPYIYASDFPLTFSDPLGLFDENEHTYGEIRSWCITPAPGYPAPAGLPDAKASIGAVCSPNSCAAANGANATAPADQAAWRNIVNATGGSDRSGGGRFMCVGTQGCWFVHRCYACRAGQRVLVNRATPLVPSGTTSVAGHGTLYFYQDSLDGWCNSQDRQSGCQSCTTCTH